MKKEKKKKKKTVDSSSKLNHFKRNVQLKDQPNLLPLICRGAAHRQLSALVRFIDHNLIN